VKLSALALCAGLLACKQPSPAQHASPAARADAAGQLSAQLAAASPRRSSYQAVEVRNAGKLAGVVKLAGAPPVLPPEKHLNDTNVCGATAVDTSLLLGPGNAVANAVVTVDVAKGKPLVPAMDAVLDQKGCAYQPRVQVLPLGSQLALVNSDPALHTVHGYAGDETVFNVAEAVQGQRKVVKLDAPALLKVRCDVHPWMTAWVDVVENPYFAVTDAQGHFAIDGLLPGTYTAHVWHERLAPTSLQVKIAAGQTTVQDVALQTK
jgi:plastocyanin